MRQVGQSNLSHFLLQKDDVEEAKSIFLKVISAEEAQIIDFHKIKEKEDMR